MAKKALVTGASSKLGQVIALSLAQNGYDMLLHYNSSRQIIDTLVKRIEALGRKADSFQLNFLQIKDGLPKDFLNFISSAEIIINNAALFERDKFSSFDVYNYHQHLTINALAPTLIVQGARLGGALKNVINILDSTLNSSSFFSYSASKVLFEHLTKIMAQELAPKVRINGIALGYVSIDDIDSAHDYNKLAYKNTLMKLPVHYKQILHTVDFILKNESIVGAIIKVDGGFYIC